MGSGVPRIRPRDNGKENVNYYSILGLYMGYIGIMEKKMETTIVYWGYIWFILG